MPDLFYAISAWVTNRAWRGIVLAVLLLCGMVAFGFVDRLATSGPAAPPTLSAALIIGSVVALFWLVMVVVWFAPQRRPDRGPGIELTLALALDFFFLVFACAIVPLIASAV